MADTTTTETAAPVAAPATPVTATTTSFWDYLKSDIGNHIKLISIIAAIIGAVILFNYVRDLRTDMENQKKITDTLSQKYQAVGPAAVTANTQATQSQVTQQATDVFGSQVMSLMQQQGAQINSLTTAIGMTNASVTALAQQVPTFTTKQQTTTDGALTGYPMEEARKNGPALSSVNLYYDPTQHDPNKAFAGTTWTHYQEQFQTTLGDWVKQSDGSFRTTVAMNRTVSKPDPNDPTKLVAVGTETIPITGANTVYTPKGLLQASDFTIPRWTMGLGLYKDKQSGYSAFGQMDYRVTNRYGIFVGTVNNGLLGGVSIRLDAKKQ